MAVPRNRVSNARKNSRRSHMAKKPVMTSKCSNCGALHRPHTLCEACGYYNNRRVIVQKEKE